MCLSHFIYLYIYIHYRYYLFVTYQCWPVSIVLAGVKMGHSFRVLIDISVCVQGCVQYQKWFVNAFANTSYLVSLVCMTIAKHANCFSSECSPVMESVKQQNQNGCPFLVLCKDVNCCLFHVRACVSV